MYLSRHFCFELSSCNFGNLPITQFSLFRLAQTDHPSVPVSTLRYYCTRVLLLHPCIMTVGTSQSRKSSLSILSRPSSFASLAQYGGAGLRHSDSNWSLISELEFPHFASEDEDWMAFGYLLDQPMPSREKPQEEAEPASKVAAAPKEGDVPDGNEPNQPLFEPLDIPYNDALLEVSEEEYELGQYAPRPVFDNDCECDEQIECEGDVPEDDDEPRPSSSASSNILQPLHIDIPVTPEPSEAPPRLCIVNLRKRRSSEAESEVSVELNLSPKRPRLDLDVHANADYVRSGSNPNFGPAEADESPSVVAEKPNEEASNGPQANDDDQPVARRLRPRSSGSFFRYLIENEVEGSRSFRSHKQQKRVVVHQDSTNKQKVKEAQKTAPTTEADDDQPVASRLRPRLHSLTCFDVKREDSVKPDGANANKDQPQLKKKHSNGVQHVKTEPIEVVNPAEISLGIDALDWGRKYIKEESDRMSQRSGRSSNSRRSIMMVRRLRESSADESAGGHRSRSPRKMHHSRHERDKDSSAEEGGVLMLCPSGTPNRGRGRPRKSESEKRRREAEERLRQLRATLNNPQRVIDTSQLHCICQTPYDDRKFYVACNTCGRWYHGKCVGISEKKAKRLSSFACGMCQDGVDKIDSDDSDDSEDEEETLTVVDRHCPRKYSQQHHPISVRELEPEKKVHLTTPIHEEEEEEEEEEEDDEDQVLDVDDMKVELYCVCQTPYDDSQFYVGCDGCEGWFHPRCVNITQEEAEMAAEYLCPSCRPRSSQEHGNTECMMEQVLNRADYPLVWRLYESVAEHRQAWPFKEPVDTQQFPTYLDVVKQPMDLSTIHNKLSSLEYRRLKEFSYDVLLMFENAKAFNIKDSAIWQCANTLEHVYRQSLTEIKAEMMTRHNNDGGDLRRVSECPSTMMDIDADQLIDVEMEMDPQFIEQLMGTPL